jgi:hypothetical protein
MQYSFSGLCQVSLPPYEPDAALLGWSLVGSFYFPKSLMQYSSSGLSRVVLLSCEPETVLLKWSQSGRFTFPTAGCGTP